MSTTTVPAAPADPQPAAEGAEPALSAAPAPGGKPDAHVFYPWAAQGVLNAVPVAGARGSYFWDETGKRYLDFSSQLVNVNIGHQHPRMVAAIQEQAAALCTIGPTVGNATRNEAARLVAELAPETSTRCSSPAVAPRLSRTRSGWPGSTPAGTRSSPPTAATTAAPPAR